jgi:hypothetical protein
LDLFGLRETIRQPNHPEIHNLQRENEDFKTSFGNKKSFVESEKYKVLKS